MTLKPTVHFESFDALDIRSGTISKAEPFARARNPSYKIYIDFGPDIGTKQTSAQVTDLYQIDDLIGKRVMGCVNIGTRNIAGFVSECLLLGFSDEHNQIHICEPNQDVPNGANLK